MKKALFLILLILVSNLLFSQVISFWQNSRNSSYTEDDQIYIRCETVDLQMLDTEIYYSSGTDWNSGDMENLSGMTYQAIVPVDPEETLLCRYKTESDTVVLMMPAFVPDDDFPVEVSELGFVSDDTVGDNQEGGTFLDLTEQYFGYSDSKFYVAMTNNGGGFPTDNGGWIPDEFYFYIGGILNPENVLQDTVLYGIVYCTIPFVAGPGLYKIQGGEIDLDALDPIGDVQSEIVGNTLILSCNIDDLVNDEDFGDWPNLSNSIGYQCLTNMITLQGEVGAADIAQPSLQNIDQYIVEPFTNILPEISDANYLILGGSTTVNCTYFDANGHFPIIAEIETFSSNGNREIYPMTPLSLDYSSPVNFLVDFPETDWNNLTIRFSDNGYEFVEESLTTSSEDLEISNNSFYINNYPNPFSSKTTISFQLNTEHTESTEIEVYNVRGQKIETFKDLQISKSPNQQIVWNAENYPSGIYFLKLRTDKNSITRKMILMQ